MNSNRVLGLIMLVVGVILLVIGISSTGKVSEEMVHGVSGKYTDKTMWYIIGGVVLVILGGAMSFRKK